MKRILIEFNKNPRKPSRNCKRIEGISKNVSKIPKKEPERAQKNMREINTYLTLQVPHTSRFIPSGRKHSGFRVHDVNAPYSGRVSTELQQPDLFEIEAEVAIVASGFVFPVGQPIAS